MLIALDMLLNYGPPFAVGLTLMLDCYMRPGELFKILLEDIAAPLSRQDSVAINMFPGTMK
jgi:hypothetical protein